MSNIVHFNMIVEINQLLKDHNIDYSIHAVGGCTCSGLELRQDGQEYPVDEIIKLINEYLSEKWMKVTRDTVHTHILNVESKFNFEK